MWNKEWKFLATESVNPLLQSGMNSAILGQGKARLLIRTSRRRYLRTENDDESSTAANKLQCNLPAGLKAFLPKFSTLLRNRQTDFDK